MSETKFIRHIAIKTTANQLCEGKYIQEDEQNPNYLLTLGGRKIHRLNLMATILSKDKNGQITSLLVDDGTGRITTRFFEESNIVNQLNIGDSILIIGRIRMYNGEKYISSEIVKRIEAKWLKVRYLELKDTIIENQASKQLNRDSDTTNGDINASDNGNEGSNNDVNKFTDAKNGKQPVIEETNQSQTEHSAGGKKSQDSAIKEEIDIVDATGGDKFKEKNHQKHEDKNNEEEDQTLDIGETDRTLPFQKISELIKELDTGEGVLIEEVIEKSVLENTEQVVEKMLENGEIFQIAPGKVKVL